MQTQKCEGKKSGFLVILQFGVYRIYNKNYKKQIQNCEITRLIYLSFFYYYLYIY